MLLQQSIEPMSNVYTHVSPILQCIGPCYLFRSFRSIFVYNTKFIHVQLSELRTQEK